MPFNCNKCNKKFKTKRSMINHKSHHLYDPDKIKVNCLFCKKNILKLPCHLKKSKNHFCNTKCFYKYKKTLLGEKKS